MISGIDSIPIRIRTSIACLALTVVAAHLVSAQSTTNELSQYTAAVAHVNPGERLLLLQEFAMRAQPGPLKVQALEFVIWNDLSRGDVTHALAWANDLENTDEDNAVALAVISQHDEALMERGSLKPGQLLKMASHGLDMLPQLQRPLGMGEVDFVLLQRDANAMLCSAAGAAEIRMKDYVSARVYLHSAVWIDPNRTQDIYNLALADLNGPDPNRKEGYWYLAKAVDLSRGTPQGIQIAQYARARYVKDGGSTGNWDQFLASAEPQGNAATATRASIASPSVPSPPSASTKAVQTAVAHPPAMPEPAYTKPPSVWADDTNSTAPLRKREIPSTTGPMSLGILVETSLTNKQNRAAVIDNLTDMLRRMNDRDEAFILTYDNNLVFEQDLTNDPQQLEQAMESINPQKGAVLDDAVAFAAGHLARIAKYPNRVLLVISDGRNVDSHSSPLQTSAEINAAGVRIYCIGVDVSDAQGQYRLQELASSTGGRSDFISTPGQFRDATKYIAQNLGIDFRF